MNTGLRKKCTGLKLLGLDFDGVFTDGAVFVDQNGTEMVRCDRKDGLGIEFLKKHGIAIYVISKEVNPVVARRCEKLQIPYQQAVNDAEGKAGILQRVAAESGFAMSEVGYMGDDLNDLAAINCAGVTFAPADAHKAIKVAVDYVAAGAGGHGAIREVVELILMARGIGPADI